MAVQDACLCRETWNENGSIGDGTRRGLMLIYGLSYYGSIQGSNSCLSTQDQYLYLSLGHDDEKDGTKSGLLGAGLVLALERQGPRRWTGSRGMGSRMDHRGQPSRLVGDRETMNVK